MCRSPAGSVGRPARSSTVPGSSCTPCQRSSPCPQDADLDDECREATQRRDVLERGVHRVALGVVQRQPRRPQRVWLARLPHWRFGLTGDEPAGGADACTYGRTPTSGRERTGIDHDGNSRCFGAVAHMSRANGGQRSRSRIIALMVPAESATLNGKQAISRS